MIAIKISLILIYQGKLGDLRDSWVKDVSNDTINFAVILTGWNNNSIKK